jgi:hypothetical protein
MKVVTVLSICFFLLFVQPAVGQERLSPNQTVGKKIEPDKADLRSMPLTDGDYVSASIGYHGMPKGKRQANFLLSRH